jgi:CRISPR/Cas system CSM-associated protein Csm3 (group 7 of RAMP superfamily)
MKYVISFYTDWHCGSGLSSGADLDLLVIKDKDRLPFIPGKTVKGLVREAVEEIHSFSDLNLKLEKVFGIEENAKKGIESEQGCCFFTNAEIINGGINKDLRDAIVSNKLQDYLYRSLASTAIDEKGIADEHSLRKMEVCVPCELEGEILDVPDDFLEIMEKGLKYIKRLGQNRNRGLGRCSIRVIQNEKGGNQ